MVMDMVITVTDMVKNIMDINKLNMKIKTYVINLKDSVHRRKTVLAELAKYPFLDVELVEAVDGRKLQPEKMKSSFDTDKFTYKYFRTPKCGEIGCTLSHRNCYRKLLESDKEYALILEDDVRFLYPEDMETTLNGILNEIKDDKPYLITLGMHMLYYPKKYRQLGKYTLYKVYDASGTCAYLVNRQAAKRLLSVSHSYTLADDFLFIRKCGVWVEGIYPTFAAGASTQEMLSTEIQEEPVVYKKRVLSQYITFFYKRQCIRMLLFGGLLSTRLYVRGVNE